MAGTTTKKSTMIEGLFSKMEIPLCSVHKKKIQTRIKWKNDFHLQYTKQQVTLLPSSRCGRQGKYINSFKNKSLQSLKIIAIDRKVFGNDGH